ncbi:MAG: putative Ig domain-containing protein, partial [bacterium]|nr:putative Ig domain-containing protein [bacterium]
NPPLVITTTSPLPPAQQGTSYSATIVVQPGTGTGAIEIKNRDNTLDGFGLAIDTATGVISGIPTFGGTANFTIDVIDAVGDSTSRAFQIEIDGQPVWTPAGGTNAYQKVSEGASLTAINAVDPNSGETVSYTVTGTLPTGITSFNSSTGAFAGVIGHDVVASDQDSVVIILQTEACDNLAPVLCNDTTLKLVILNDNRDPIQCDVSTTWIQTIDLRGTPVQICFEDPDKDLSGTPEVVTISRSGGDQIPSGLTLNSNGTWSGRVDVTEAGTYSIDLDLDDQSGGNVTHTMTLVVTPDGTAPYVSTPAAVDNANLVTVGVTDDGVGVDTVGLLWKFGNSDQSFSGTYLSMTEAARVGSEATFNVTISDNGIEDRGLLVRFIMVDSIPNVETTAWIPVAVPFVQAKHRMSETAWLGTKDSLWHLVSFPGDYGANSTVRQILDNLSGLGRSLGGDVLTDDWRIVARRPGAFAVLSSENENNLIVPGEGYWFRHINKTFNLTMPAGTTVDSGTFTMNLHSGWNLIGNPYFYPIQVSTAAMNSAGLSSIKAANPAAPGASRASWENNLVTAGSGTVRFDPWVGYAVNCENGGGCTLVLDPQLGATGTPKPTTLTDGWMADVRVLSNGKLKDAVTIGHYWKSEDGPDIYDVRPGGFVGGTTDVLLKSDTYGEFVRDIRSGTEVQEWNLNIGKNVTRASLSWDRVELDEEMALVLRDVVMGTIVDMTLESQYIIGSPEQLPEGRFVVYFGDRDGVDAASRRPASTLPVAYGLYQNYPNPFNPSTTILFDVPKTSQISLEVYNVLGRRVAVLGNDTYAAGSHSIRWDGRTDQGTPVASGIYFARMVAKDFHKSVTMMLVK